MVYLAVLVYDYSIPCSLVCESLAAHGRRENIVPKCLDIVQAMGVVINVVAYEGRARGLWNREGASLLSLQVQITTGELRLLSERSGVPGFPPTRHKRTNLLPLSLWFELMDIMFLINCFKYPDEHFSFVKFTTNRTRSSSNCKLKCILPLSSNNHLNFIFFNRVVKLWNALPIIDLHLSINILEHNLRIFFWNHFIDHFNPNFICTWHLICPCSSCFTNHTPHNHSLLSCQY